MSQFRAVRHDGDQASEEVLPTFGQAFDWLIDQDGSGSVDQRVGDRWVRTFSVAEPRPHWWRRGR